MNTSKVTRVEVIDHTRDITQGGGRAYFFMKEGVQVELSLQDDDRTLKVFISSLRVKTDTCSGSGGTQEKFVRP